MRLNKTKSKLLYFTKASPMQNILPTELMSIKSVQCLRLLGVTFTNDMNLATHFQLVIKKASQRLYYLKCMKPFLKKNERWHVYIALIRSILEYGAPMFSSIINN